MIRWKKVIVSVSERQKINKMNGKLERYKKVCNCPFDAIGNTPMMKVGYIYAKLEAFNITGSVKDRMASYMIERAEERGELKPGSTIIEVTSGNTGVALSMISAIKGYKFIAVMPESMSIERRKMIEAFGGEIVLTPAEEDMEGAVRKYEELKKENPDAWLSRQFENPDNIEAHYKGIGREIIKQTEGRVDVFVAGMGTGGTLIGVAKALKEVNPDVKIIGIEPEESAVINGKNPGRHRIQGIGEGFIPKIIKDNMNLIDKVVTVSSKDAIETSEMLARKFGLLVGISSGANIAAASSFYEDGKNVVTILCDRGERYLSTDLFQK